MLKILIAAVILGSSSAAFAGPQQEKMKVCNEEAKGKKGEERKAFMKECLSAGGHHEASSQQEKMKDCNVKAKGMKGEDRKKFMSECLSKH